MYRAAEKYDLTPPDLARLDVFRRIRNEVAHPKVVLTPEAMPEEIRLLGSLYTNEASKRTIEKLVGSLFQEM